MATWYNRPRRFDNGIQWVRLRRHGFGLWIQRRDEARPGAWPDSPDCPSVRLPAGRRVRLYVLLPYDPDAEMTE